MNKPMSGIVTVSTTEAVGVFRPVRTLSTPDASSAGLAAVLSYTSKPLTVREVLDDALELANECLTRHGLPTDISIQLSSKHSTSQGETLVQQASVPVNIREQPAEVHAAIDLKMALSALNPVVSATDAITLLSALEIGQLMMQLMLQRDHGARIDAKRKSEDALTLRNASRKRTREEEVKIERAYAQCRSQYKFDSDAYQHVVDELKQMNLTAGAVRHIIKKPARKKKA